jgi:hypothetical protein
MREVQYPSGMLCQDNGFNKDPETFIQENVSDEEFYIPRLNHMEVWSWNEDLSPLSRGQKVNCWKKFKSASFEEALQKFPA